MKTLKGPKKATKVRKSTLSTKQNLRASKAVNLLSLFPDYRKVSYIKHALEQRITFLSELKEAYLHKGLVLYLGAVISHSIGLPGWQQLIRSLTVTMMTRKVRTAIDAMGGLSEDQQWKTIQEVQKKVEKTTDSDKPILMMARSIKDSLGDHLPIILARYLYLPVRLTLAKWNRERQGNIMNSPPYPLPSSELVDAIVGLARSERDVSGVQAIVNYNYDNLLDSKLREQNVRSKTVRSGRDKVPAGTLPCYHVHGVLPFEQSLGRGGFRNSNTIGNFVFSEDEYHKEYSDAYRWSNMTQMSLLGRYTGLFVGLSLEDPNIRRLIDVTHRQYPEISNYAILTRRRPLTKSGDSRKCVLRNLFEAVETESFAKIGVKVIWVDNYEDIPKALTEIYKIDA